MNVAASKGRSGEASPSAEALFRRRLAKTSDQLATRLDITFRSNPFRSLRKRFVIASSARTGSSLLSQSLQVHGAIVQEFFHPRRIDREIATRPISTLEAYLEAMFKDFAVGGTFGVKGSFPIVTPMMLAKEFPEFLGDWRFVYLTRTDMLKQAISHYIADLSGAWRSGTSGREVTDEDFDGAAIAALSNGHRYINARWEDIFGLFAIEPLRITYEELSADTEAVAARVAGFLDLHGPPIARERLAARPLEIQATPLNERWRARLVEEGWQSAIEEA